MLITDGLATPIVPCRDLDASETFYARLGFHRFGPATPDYRLLVADGTMRLHLRLAPDLPRPPNENTCGLYLYRQDVHAWAERLVDLLLPPHRAEPKPWGMLECALSDPDGALIRIGWRADAA